ncbi:MAG TPA: hypothetical protein VM509_14490 [Planctomycetota bacterium]|nr:hypothetical protein [Planctomycetota bacterium]
MGAVCKPPEVKPFEPKADKDGKFASDTKVFDGPVVWGVPVPATVELSGKLISPAGLTIDGTLSFNGTKKSFSAKTGDTCKFGTFTVQKKNSIQIEGKTSPATPNVVLKFQVTSIGCIG